MSTFDKVNRRTHLYLGLFLMPWLVLYGVSSFLVIHQSWFPSGRPAPETLFAKAYRSPVDLRGANNSPELRAAARQILKDCGMDGAFWTDKPKPDTLHIDRFSFRDSINLTYSAKDQRLTAERQPVRWTHVPLRMHFRGGYEQPSPGDKLWGLAVDLACIGILVWVASGLVMWWRLPRLRGWGALAVGGGVLSFVGLAWML
jgi:hypothetical protein